MVGVGRDDERTAAVAETGVLAAARAGRAYLRVADREGWNLQRLVHRLAFLRINDLDIDLVQFARSLELLVFEQLALGDGPAPGHDVHRVFERLEIPNRPPAGNGRLGAGAKQAVIHPRVSNADRGGIGDGRLELDQSKVGLLSGEIGRVHYDL